MMTSEYVSDVFDPYDLDREEFNPAMCMLRYSRECNLSNMLARKYHIDREINLLNSHLQNLLYDNYQKIDKVTSVIQGMKTNFQKMEQKMDDLYDKMNGIARTSCRVLDSWQPVEDKMSNLLKMQDTIKKLSLLTDLASALKVLVKSGVHSSAARYYLKAEKLLKKYSHLPSLSGIVKECLEIVVEIKSGLRNKLNCEMYGKEELSDTLKLLLALEETSETLLEHFLICGDKCLVNLLILIDEIWTKDYPEKIEDHFLNKLSNYVNSCCNYVEKLSNVLKTAKTVFQPRKDLKIDCLSSSLEKFFLKNMGRLRTKLLHHIKENFHDIDDDLLSQVLDKFIRQCHESGIIKSQINFYSEGLDIVLQICISHYEKYLETMKEDFNRLLGKQVDELSPETNIPNLVLFLNEWIEKNLMSVLLSAVHYIRPEFRCCREPAFRKIFCKVVVREGTCIAFIRYIIEQSWLFLTAKHIKSFPKPLLCAVLAKFLLDFSDVALKFLAKVDDFLSSTSEGLSLTSHEAIIIEFKNAAMKAVDLYIQIRYQTITHMLQKSMENRNWMTSKEPTRPRAVIKMMLNDLLEAKLEIEKIFGTCYSPRRKRGSSSGSCALCEMYSIDDISKQNAIEERVLFNKMFLECSKSPTKVDLNTPSIINFLLKKILNSFIQLIRLKTLNHFSLQQIQVDVCYLQCHLSELIELDAMVQSLFDEIMASACNRTVNPQLMNNQIVSVICGDVL